jgi:hypothetical protein
MRTLLTLIVMIPGLAQAEACWNEWEYKDQWMIRAGSCAENVSIPDFARGFCKSRVQGDAQRTAQACPNTAKSKEGLEIVTQPVVAKCLGIKPPLAGGSANIFYYGGKSYSDSRESLRSLCKGFEGTWAEGPK